MTFALYLVRNSVSRSFILVGVLLSLSSSPAFAQKESPSLTQRIDERSLVRLAGNTRPEASAVNDRGPVADQFPIEHMLLLLRRSSEQDRALEQFIDELHDPGSPNFHKWLTAKEFGDRYGLAPADILTVTRWLQLHGFTVGTVYPNGLTIDFSGTAAQVRTAFHTEIHHIQINGEQHIANMSDPQIPSALAPAVAGIVSLNDFRPHPMHHPVPPSYTGGNGRYLLVPADLATIYNFNLLFNAKGNSGQGQTVVVVEDTNVYSTNDWNTFRSTLGLATAYPSGSFTQVHPASSGTNNCTDPGVNGNAGEAILDAEWASAAAPSATIELASCADTTTNFGGFVALQNLLNAAGTPPAIISVSYGDSETDDGASFNAWIKALYQQAVTAGVSVFVSSGDYGAAVTDENDTTRTNATHGINVNGWASTVYNVAVGGTDFDDTYLGQNSVFWGSTNDSNYGSALSYIPEIPWNDSCASLRLALYNNYGVTYGAGGFCNSTLAVQKGLLNITAGSGGPSACATGTPSSPGVVGGSCAGYPKPSWQSLVGNPSDGVRDLPDVSLFASNGIWSHAYVYCDSNPNGGKPCTGAPNTWSAGGGTSFSAPIMAGVQALINQYTGMRWGNPNPTYYSLARTEYGTAGNTYCRSSYGKIVASTCIFYDVTNGDIDLPCTGGNNCYTPSGTYGVLSTSNTSYQPAYGTITGWDFATGIGTINVYNLAEGFKANTPSTYQLTVAKAGLGSGTVTSTSPDTQINCGSSCSGNYSSGTSVTLSATPASGSSFGGWSGCTSTSGTTCTVIMPSNSTGVTATFNATSTTYTLSVNKAGTGSGTVTSTSPDSQINCGSACSGSYASGTSVVLSATPASGSTFSNWSGCTSTSGSTCTVTVSNNPTSVVATFTANVITLPTVTTTPATSLTTFGGTINGTVNPNGAATTVWFEYGMSSTLQSYTSYGNWAVPAGSNTVPFHLTWPAGLPAGETFYYRIAASNPRGTVRGSILSCTMLKPLVGDFNGDGNVDVFWRNLQTGDTYMWLMNGLTVANSGPLSTIADTNWQVVGAGDFDGDGKADIFWHNFSTGENYLWLMNVLSIVNSGPLPTISDPNWQIVGVGDFNGDRKADVLWRNMSTGENYLWLMDGLAVSSSGPLPQISDLNWQIVGIGDFDASGKAGILWRNMSTGENYVWLMDGLSVASGGPLPAIGSQQWQVAGLGDFNNDGKADILWRNLNTGENYMWMMSGTSVISNGPLPQISDLNWEIVGAGKFNGTLNPAGILWRRSVTGEDYMWLMNGLTVSAGSPLPQIADQNWQIP